MLEKFGGNPDDPDSRGRVMMDTDKADRRGNGTLQSRVQRLGEHTQTGTVDAKDRATEGKIRTEFDEMAQTSTNFMASLPDEKKAELVQARAAYFEYMQAKHAAGKHPSQQQEDDLAVQEKMYRTKMGEATTTWTDELSDKNADDGFLRQELSNPKLMFGGELRKDGTFGQPEKVAKNLPLMQLVEKGFIRNDDADAKGGVFNADVMVALARQGFAPGATYGDTMHFDYIQGFADAVDKGVANRSSFGPHGPSTPAEKQ